MAYERYGMRDSPPDERARWQDDREQRGWDRGGRHEDRGFFERAGDEIASWFGDDEAERRRREDERMREREPGRERGRGGGYYYYGSNREPGRGPGIDRQRESSFERPDGDYGQREPWGRGERERGSRDYRPMAGDYGRSGSFAARRYGSGERGFGERSDRDYDPHYYAWRQRHMSELDRDYDEYRREHQSQFEHDFGSWRERRQQKRGLLGQIREQMEVVGSDDQHVGTVDRVAGDRIVLTRSDPESGGAHHSLSCSDIDRVEGDRVVLDLSAEQATHRWRDESRERALFEREDQGEMGPHNLDRSFAGTYR